MKKQAKYNLDIMEHRILFPSEIHQKGEFSLFRFLLWCFIICFAKNYTNNLGVMVVHIYCAQDDYHRVILWRNRYNIYGQES